MILPPKMSVMPTSPSPRESARIKAAATLFAMLGKSTKTAVLNLFLPRLYAASLRLFESELSAEATGFTKSGSEAMKAAITRALKLKTISKFKPCR